MPELFDILARAVVGGQTSDEDRSVMSDQEVDGTNEDTSYRGERAIDVHGLATMLNVSESTAYTLANDPLFPSFQVGRRHRFWPSEVRAYLSSGVPWLQSRKSLGRKRIGR